LQTPRHWPTWASNVFITPPYSPDLAPSDYHLFPGLYSGFGGLVVSMLASGTRDRGFEPGQSRRIFRAKKSTAFLRRGSKAICPMSQICGM
jgi:hypothetical protein